MRLLGILLLAILTFGACKKDKEGTIELTFKGKYGANTFVLNEDQDYNGKALKFSKFRFFLTDITLLGDEEVVIQDVAEIDFDNNHQDAVSAANGETLSIDKIPEGSYTGIRFTVGVSETLNNTVPADYSTSHILGNSTNYWEAWNSYIHAKIEGRMDTDASGIYDLAMLYHTGITSLTRTKTISKSIDVIGDGTVNLSMNIDIQKIFNNGTEELDIEATPISHTNPSDGASVIVSTFIMDNFPNSITLSE